MAQCKGLAVASRLAFVRERYGEPGLTRLAEALSPSARAAVQGHILPHAWVPMDLLIEVSEVADRVFGHGDLTLCVEMGAWGADKSLPRIFRVFYRLGSPMFLVGKAAKLWRAHYDSGRVETSRDASGRVHFRILEFERPHRAHCLAVLGWIRRSFELSGAVIQTAEETRCRTQGAEVCELEFSWR